MEVTVESTGTLERRMRVELPLAPIEQQVDSRLKSVGRTAKIKGFRPGKVPAKVVRQRYGKQVREEVLNEVLQQSYSAAVTQEKLNPASGPTIETEADNGKTFAFTATFEIMPEVELKDLEKIKIEKPEVTISDEDVDDMLMNLRKQKATWETVKREAVEGDRVVVDFDGTLKGEPIEGGTGKEVPVVLGEGQMLPGFEKGLTGVKADEEKSFKVKFPKDYHIEELAKKQVEFAVKVHRVEEQELPALDDSLAELYGVAEGGLKKLRQDVVENMEREAEQKVRNDVREQAMTGLLDANAIEVPKSLLQQEAHSMQHDAMRQFGIEDHDQAPPIDDFTESAQKRVQLSLLIKRLVEDNGIALDASRLRERVEQICAGYENAEEMVTAYLGNPQVMARIEPLVMEEQAVEWIIENGVEKLKKISFKDYMKP